VIGTVLKVKEEVFCTQGAMQMYQRERVEGVPRVFEGQCDRYTAAEGV
jgi:hypothetical protein